MHISITKHIFSENYVYTLKLIVVLIMYLKAVQLSISYIFSTQYCTLWITFFPCYSSFKLMFNRILSLHKSVSILKLYLLLKLIILRIQRLKLTTHRRILTRQLLNRQILSLIIRQS